MLSRQSLSTGATARLTSVDGCRGIAALLVVLLHASETVGKAKYFGNDPMHGWMQFGVRGVDFFFVLSGFVIAYAHRNDLGKPQLVKTYGLKRFVRLYPPYLAFTLPLVVMSLVLGTDNLPSTFAGTVTTTVGTLALVPTSNAPILGTAWTLEHEVLFYLLFALVILSPRFGIAALAAWGALCAANLAVGFPHNYLSDFVFRPYNLEFLLGVGAGFFLRTYRVPFPAVVVAAGLILFSAGAVLHDCGYFEPIDDRMPYTAQRFFEWQLLVSGVSSGLIVLGISQLDLDGKTVPNRYVAGLGAASYSIYLTHLPVISILCKALRHTGIGAPVAWGLCVFGGVGSGLVFHFAVERRVVDWAREWLLPNGQRKASTFHPEAACSSTTI